MAMEVGRKHLVWHSLPLAALVFGMALLSVLAVQQLQLGNTRGIEVLGRGLTTRFVEVKPTATGMVDVSINNQTETPREELGDASEAGRAAQFTFSFR